MDYEFYIGDGLVRGVDWDRTPSNGEIACGQCDRLVKSHTQCCGAGSAWIHIHLPSLLICGSGSRSEKLKNKNRKSTRKIGIVIIFLFIVNFDELLIFFYF